MDTTKTRLMAFIESQGMKTKAFEIRCGLSNGYIANMRKGLGEDKLNNVLTAFPQLNKNWLLFGEGNMLNEETIEKIQPVAPTEGNVRYWNDVSATGGGAEFLENPDEHQTTYYNLPNFHGHFDAVSLFGNSMYPLYKDGEVIILEKWEESFIDYGKVYLIITRKGNRMVKYLRKAKDDAHVLCLSENKDYDPFEIEKNDIKSLYIVRGRIIKNTL